jgi:hypothetical protein
MKVRIVYVDGEEEEYSLPAGGSVSLKFPFVDDAGHHVPREWRELYLADAERPAKRVEIVDPPRLRPPPEPLETEEYVVSGKDFFGRHVRPELAEKIVYRGRRPVVKKGK